MNKNIKQEERIALLIERLSLMPSTLNEIIKYLRKYKNIDISGITFKRDKKEMLARGVPIIYESGTYKISGEINTKKEMMIDDEYIHDLPILFSILNSEKDLRIIDWLKDELKENYNIDEENWKNETYFSKSLVEQNHDIILELCIEIIKYMKRGESIEFEYRKVENNEFKKYTVAPLQIRLHDDLYYLFCCVYKVNSLDYSVLSFRIDMIEDLKIFPVKSALKANEEKKLLFNYKELVQIVDLKNYFNYCIGVYNPTSVNLSIKPKPIQIKFSGWACTYVTKKIIHHTQRIPKGIEKEIGGDGEKIFCIVHIKVYDTDELKFLLGRFRNYAQRLN
jgi:predicted DNA-binding transcriptional regulator YafY